MDIADVGSRGSQYRPRIPFLGHGHLGIQGGETFALVSALAGIRQGLPQLKQVGDVRTDGRS